MEPSSTERHVAVLAFPFATHPGLLFGLARRLATAAPSTTFTFFSTARSNAKVFAAPGTPPNIKRRDVPDGVPEGHVPGGRGPEVEIGMFLKSAPESFREGVAAAERESGGKVGCVVADAFLSFAGDVAAELGVPWVPVWTSAAGSLLLHVYTDFVRQTVGVEGIAERQDEIVTSIPGFPELRLGDIQSGVVAGNLDSPFAVMLLNMGRALPRATAVAINSFHDLDPAIVNILKTKLPNFLNVGPFNVTSPPPPLSEKTDEDCVPWLDGQPEKSVAYIAFGTVSVPPPDELAAVAEALEETRTPFLWSLREDLTCNLPKGFLERTKGYGKIVPWAPQVRVLGHGSVGVFVSHGGWNSVLESITAGVPLICRPFFGDHFLNSWMVERVWKIGVKVERGVFTKNGTRSALEKVLRSDLGKGLKSQAEVYKDFVSKAVGPNGSSTQDIITLTKIVSG